MAPTYKQLNKTHDKYNADYWSELKTLAHGGNIMNKAMLKKLLPKVPGEEDEVYEHRINTSYFVPYLGSMLGYYASSVISDPLKMNTDDPNVAMPEYYEDFEESVYRRGSYNVTANEHIRCVLESAFLSQTAYTLVDFPELPDEEEPPATKLEEELLGMDQAYLCPIDASEVYNWREDDEGNLIWISVHCKDKYQEDVTDDNATIVETFTIYYSDRWERHTYKWKENQRGPKANDPPTESKSGPHSFGRVPVVRFCLPDTLYFGDKIGSIAKKLFQKMNALDWSSDRSLFQFLVVNLQNPSMDAPSPIADDSNRAVNQIIGPGRALVLAEKDKAAMLGADSSPFDWAQNHISWLRDEMARIINQTALSLSFNNKAMVRSMESKSFDHKAMEIILEHLGQICKDYMEEIFDMVAAGRGEAGQVEFRASGMSSYNQIGEDELLDMQNKFNLADFPSATLKADYSMGIVKQLLEGAPKERLDIIQQELEAGYAQQKDQEDELHEMNVQSLPE